MRNRLVSFCLLLSCLVQSSFASGLRPTHTSKVMVVSIHHDASDAGVEVLKAGGNAVDAAVATGFALAVVHPVAGNIGGGGFMLFRTASGEVHFLDYREKAPMAATSTMYQDARGNVVADMSLVGYKAAGVPGSVAGMAKAEMQWGKLTLAQVMAPAIRLARDGFTLTWEEARALQEQHLSEFPESRRIFQRDGNYYRAGDVLKQPELAATLARIAADPDDFYHGEIAKKIADDQRAHGGLITERDLAGYEAKERTPVHGTYRGLDIYSAPPPSSGGIVLIEMLNMLEGYDLHKMGALGSDSMHLTAESMKRAFMDRADFLGDPDFSQIPTSQLIDKQYATKWRESIDPQHTTAARELKRPDFEGLDRIARAIPAAEPNQTTHYSVVDASGNAVSVTTTLNGGFGSYVTVPGLGFLLNNEMDDFAAKVGVPNGYGLIQGPANAVGPGHRPLSAMTPTIVTDHGKLFLVLGSPGGPTIINTVLEVLQDVVDYGMDIQQAVATPRFHHQWLPDEIRIEPGISPDTRRLLEQRGHRLDEESYWGDAECIMIDLKTGERLGGQDPRHNFGKAAGY